MCGIFGVVTLENAGYRSSFLKKSLTTLGRLSESRGKDSSGICVMDSRERNLSVIRGNIPTTSLFSRRLVKNSMKYLDSSDLRLAFGHARLVTNGSQLDPENNQPTVKSGIVGVHNGIITNVDDLWAINDDLKRSYEIDTEVLLSIVRKNLSCSKNIEHAVSKAFSSIEGTASVALMFEDYDKFILATNNGSLYVLLGPEILYFASERVMLSKLAKTCDFDSAFSEYEIVQLRPNSICAVGLDSMTIQFSKFSTSEATVKSVKTRKPKVKFTIDNIKRENQLSALIDINLIGNSKANSVERNMLLYPYDEVSQLKRCSKCVLPETFPFISFDETGVCNYCKGHKPQSRSSSIAKLKDLIAPFKSGDGTPDVLVPFSGGRDSTYSIHVIKNELGLNPITYTYDWGMVTDLARRNIARTCGKLGVENIIVAADIHKKRRNIRLNIEAWLRRPELGMIPLFMAGDKYFFYYANKVCKDNKLYLAIWGSNYLENTDFKTGFCGIEPNFDKERIDALNGLDKAKLSAYFLRNFIKNPGYLNASIYNTLGAFFSRYGMKRTGYFQLFDHLIWDEQEVDDVIQKEYNWELSVDSTTTWRIGDGTAAFYNYIYYLVAGFSEFDTFRSNQIREGMITRDKALELLEKENEPRYETIKWYLEIVGLNYENVINKVNNIKRLY